MTRKLYSRMSVAVGARTPGRRTGGKVAEALFANELHDDSGLRHRQVKEKTIAHYPAGLG